MIDSCHGLGLGHWSRVIRVTGQLTNGSRGSRVTKCDPPIVSSEGNACIMYMRVYGRFPESHFRGKTFPGKTFTGKSFSRKIIVFHCFNVKQTLTVFCVNWRIILLTGLLLIREVLQRGPALLIFTLSALSGQVPAHHVGPICSRRVMLSKSDAGSGHWLVGDRRF